MQEEEYLTLSGMMSRLSISALQGVSKDSSCWSNPIVHKAILISGLSVLTAATTTLKADLALND